jgi:hypothetical protein
MWIVMNSRGAASAARHASHIAVQGRHHEELDHLEVFIDLVVGNLLSGS